MRRAGGRRLVALLLAVVALSSPLLVAGSASAFGVTGIVGFPIQGGFVIPQYQGLIETTPISAGTLVFGDEIWLQVVNVEGNRTVRLTTIQNATDGLPTLWANQTVSLAEGSVTTVDFFLPSSQVQRTTELCIAGGCITFVHATPISLIPAGVLNIGGIDLLVLSVVIETAVLLYPATVAARGIARKALFTPKFRAWLWAPHVVLGFFLLAVVDYQAVDGFFGGTEFILYPVAFVVLFFIWVLHLFNTAEPVEVLRPDPARGHRLRYNRWRIWTGELADGTIVLIDTRWRGWLARLLGHHSVLVPRDAPLTTGAPAGADLSTYRVRPERESPLDDFPIVGDPDAKERNPPKRLYWVNSDDFLEWNFPRLVFSRLVEVPPKVKDGVVVAPATSRRRLSWPHYEGGGVSRTGLASIHYYDVPVAALGWKSNERAWKVVETLKFQIASLRAEVKVRADEWAEERLAGHLRMLDRTVRPLTDGEAEADTKAPGRTEERTEVTRETYVESSGPVGNRKARPGGGP